ncbi:hypothetical protein WN943_025011 [Citrus x changshan-huyou]
MANKVKKSNKKQPIPFRKETNVLGLKPWSDLPEQLINVILWQYSTLMFDMSYGGVTKSWRSAQTKQCSNPGAITQPWLELHDVNEDTEFKFNISFHQGERTWLEILFNIVDDVEVFRLDIGTLSWIKMERLGDRTLFLGSDCCMSARKLKKQIKKRVSLRIEADANGLRPWPGLPQQLINVISWPSSALMLDISYGGVTKSWSIQTKQCNSQAMIQQPRLELHDVKEDTKFKFSTTFLQGEWAWNVCNAKTRPIPAPWKHYVGYSDGALVSRGASPNEYYLHFPEAGEPYHLLPSWDPRIPFRRVVISSSTRSPYWNMNSLVMVLTGTTYPALVFYRKKQGAEYAWMKQDSAIPDPNCNSYKSERNRFMRFTNAIAHKGKFYALSLHGTLGVIEDIESQPRITALGPKTGSTFRGFKSF